MPIPLSVAGSPLTALTVDPINLCVSDLTPDVYAQEIRHNGGPHVIADLRKLAK